MTVHAPSRRWRQPQAETQLLSGQRDEAAATLRAVQARLQALEAIRDLLGPHFYLRLSIHPGLDAIRMHPRYLALKAAYERTVAQPGAG